MIIGSCGYKYPLPTSLTQENVIGPERGLHSFLSSPYIGLINNTNSIILIPSFGNPYGKAFSMKDYVRTYVNHVRNICHLELANPLTKRTLLVIGYI